MTEDVNSWKWWDKIANLWKDKGDDRDRPDEYKLLAEMMEGDGSVLEVGCGFGTFCMYTPMSTHYLGMDVSEQMVQEARQRFPTRMFLRGDITRAPVGQWGRTFAWSACFQTLEHFDRETCLLVVEKLMAVARRGLVFSLPAEPARAHKGHVLEWASEAEVLDFFGGFGSAEAHTFGTHYIGRILHAEG